MKRYFKCEIKTANRWQQISVNKWVNAFEPNHLNGWFIQEQNTIMLLTDTKQAVEYFLEFTVWIIYCWWNGAKTGNMVSKP